MILDTLNAGYALAMFLLAGVIPGTNTVIDAASMLESILLVSGFILSRITLTAVRGYSRLQASNGTILSAQS